MKAQQQNLTLTAITFLLAAVISSSIGYWIRASRADTSSVAQSETPVSGVGGSHLMNPPKNLDYEEPVFRESDPSTAHREQIIAELKRGANFKDVHTVVLWECGEDCVDGVSVERLTGRLKKLPVVGRFTRDGNSISRVSYSYKIDDELLRVAWVETTQSGQVICHQDAYRLSGEFWRDSETHQDVQAADECPGQ